jgi:hypothetical protein
MSISTIFTKDNAKTLALGILMFVFFPVLALAYVIWTGGKLARDLMKSGF